MIHERIDSSDSQSDPDNRDAWFIFMIGNNRGLVVNISKSSSTKIVILI